MKGGEKLLIWSPVILPNAMGVYVGRGGAVLGVLGKSSWEKWEKTKGVEDDWT